MFFQWHKKHAEYLNAPHDTLELQPLFDGLNNGATAGNNVAQNDTVVASKPGTIAETQLFRLENIGVPVCYFTVGICQGMC